MLHGYPIHRALHKTPQNLSHKRSAIWFFCQKAFIDDFLMQIHHIDESTPMNPTITEESTEREGCYPPIEIEAKLANTILLFNHLCRTSAPARYSRRTITTLGLCFTVIKHTTAFSRHNVHVVRIGSGFSVHTIFRSRSMSKI